MASATLSFPTYSDMIDSIAGVDLQALDLDATLTELTTALTGIDNYTVVSNTEVSGTFPGGVFNATGNVGATSATLKAMDIDWLDHTMHLEGSVVVKQSGEYTGFLSEISYDGPEMSFQLLGKLNAAGGTAWVTSAAFEVGDLACLIKGKMTVDTDTGALGGTISQIDIDDGVYAASVSKLKLSVTDFLGFSDDDALPVLFAGNDTITAVAESVELKGFGGKDVLKGSIGDDVLYGGNGNDKLTGGLGVDEFMFDVAPQRKTNADTITDFSIDDGDTIMLDNEIFTEQDIVFVKKLKDKVDIDESDFDSASYTGLVYEMSTGKLYYDTSDSAGGELVVTLVGKPPIDSDAIDFFTAA